MRILLASIYPYLFLLLYLTIPFDNYVRALPNILLAILAILFPLVVSKEDFKKIRKIPFVIVLVFFGYLLCNALFMGRLEMDWNDLKRIILPLGLVLLYIPLQDFKKINKAIIFSSLAAIICSIISVVIEVNSGVQVNFLNTATIIEALLIDRLYLGLLCMLSILISFHFLKDDYHPDNKYYLINIIINVLFILLIMSRIAIVTLIIIFIISLFYKKKKGPQLFFATGILVLTVVLIFVLNNDLRKQIFYSKQGNQGLVENTLSLEPRTMIWSCAYKVASNENVLWSGIGFVNTNTKLQECYTSSIENEEKKNWFITQNYNTHNQFFDIYLATGVIALILLIISILIFFFKNRKEFYSTSLLITFITFALVENLFHRQIGVYYVGFILIALLIAEQSKEKHSINPV